MSSFHTHNYHMRISHFYPHTRYKKKWLSYRLKGSRIDLKGLNSASKAFICSLLIIYRALIIPIWRIQQFLNSYLYTINSLTFIFIVSLNSASKALICSLLIIYRALIIPIWRIQQFLNNYLYTIISLYVYFKFWLRSKKFYQLVSKNVLSKRLVVKSKIY